MKRNIDEYYFSLKSNNIKSFYEDICCVVKNKEPNLTISQIKESISNRENLGDGLVDDTSLIIHVINDNVESNCVIYCYLKNELLWESNISKLKANLSKVMLIIINPNLKNGQAVNISNFFNGKKLKDVKLLVMR